jgi:type IV pilus assembly protein PilP
MINNVFSKNSFLAIALVACLCFVGALDAAFAQPDPAVATPNTSSPALAQEAALAPGQSPPFTYNRERPDPFFPFLTQEIMKAEAKAKAELTGTQRFEPAQLTLVAIVSGRRGLLAMVQDSSGVGYVLRKGTKIGETGEVVQILPNKVIIEQVKNVTGDRISRKFEMLLSKEGEK